MPSIEISATWESLPTLNAFVDHIEAELPLSDEQKFIMRLVVEEIVTNIIKYAYPEAAGPITLECDYQGVTMLLVIRDCGEPFDPRDAAMPDLSSDVESREVGGLGIFLVLDMVDSLDYEHGEDSWNTLTITKRQSEFTLAELLRQVSLFDAFDDQALAKLSAEAVERRLLSGEVLCEEGEAGDSCFVLLTGRLQVLKRIGQEELVLDTVQPGGLIGEIALLDHSPRSATLRAGADCRLLVLDEERFYDLMHNNPAAALDLLRGGTQRLRGTIEHMVAGLEQKNAALSQAYQELKAAQDDQLRLGRIQQELQVARRIQEVFLPHTLPQPRGWQIVARNRGAQEVGGDFFDCIALPQLPPELEELARIDPSCVPNYFVGLVMADVCGKGIPAALFVALTRSLLRAAAQWTPLDEPQNLVTGALRLANDYIATEHARSNMFITMFFGVLDPASGELFYVNAGHNPPLLVRTSGAIEPLPATDIPLGIMAGQSYSAQRAELLPGDLLVAFTDGVTEALNPEQEEFGDDRLVALLHDTAGTNAQQTLDMIERAVDTFAAGAPQADDITLLVASRRMKDEG